MLTAIATVEFASEGSIDNAVYCGEHGEEGQGAEFEPDF